MAIFISSTLRIVLTYVFHPFRPRFGLKAWRQIANFSIWSWLLSLTSLARDRCDTFVIGRVMDIANAGFFSAAVEIAVLPASELVAPLQRASFSAFASTRHAGSNDDTITTYLRVLSSAVLLALPASLGISMVGPLIVEVAFGERWRAASVVIEVTGLGLSLMAMGMISAPLLNAYGQLRGMFKIQLAAVIVRIPLAIFLVSRFGLLGGAIAGALGTGIEQMLYVAMALHRLRLSPMELIRHNGRALIGGGTMVAGMMALGLAWMDAPTVPGKALQALAISVATGAFIYTTAVVLLWLAAGRPVGAERDAMELLRRLGRRATSVVRKQWIVLYGHG